MRTITVKTLSIVLLFGLLAANLYGQPKRKGGSSKTPPKKSADRDLQPKSSDSSVSKTPAADLKFAKDKRLALVIGNSEYESSPLRNPVNDARLIGESLERLGFQVIVKENSSFQEMNAAIRDFSRQLAAGSVGLFYFAGHGVQINGRNFLIPSDFGASQTDVAKQAVEVDFVIREMSGKSALNILILDACRNAPAGLTASADGLAEIKNAPAGMYLAFSTAPGKTAKDGAGDNSPYTESLADNLRSMRPSRLEDVFIRTRIQMEMKTQGEQTPWESSSIRHVFFFAEDPLAQNAISSNNILGSVNVPGVGKILNLPVVVPVLNEAGKLTRQMRQNAAYFVENKTGLEMARIGGGRFSMGTNWEEIEAAFNDTKRHKLPKDLETIRESIAAEMPQHQVNVPGFFMSRHEITQAQWQAVMGSLPNDIPPDFRGPNLPVVNVNWRQANMFCERLSKMTGQIYRLPSEAEWEYAARGGTETPFAFGKTITSSYANFKGTFPFLSAPKSEFRAGLIPAGSLGNYNGFGLADMHGNVWEWPADNWHDDYTGAPTDGSAWETDAPDEESEEQDPQMIRVARGGSWDSIPNECRSTSRRKYPQTFRSTKVGFRVVMQ